MNAREKVYDQIIFGCFYLFLFCLSFIPVVSSIAIGAALVIWLVGGYYRQSFREFRTNYRWWLLPGFYLLHAISLLWSDNYSYGLFDLQIKLTFLICPLIIAGLTFSPTVWQRLRLAFITGTTIAGACCFGYALFRFIPTGEKDFLFYNSFSLFMHPTYFIVYLNLSMLFIIYHLFYERPDGKNLRILYFSALVFQLLIIFMLSSRTALAVALFSFMLAVLVLIREKKLRRKDLGYVGTFFGLAIIFQVSLFIVFNRYTQIKTISNTEVTQEQNSVSIRYMAWKAAGEIIQENPLSGVGAGDLKEAVVSKYQTYNYEYGIKHKVSPHNQYLHTAVILGAVGIIFLLAIFISGFISGLKRRDWLSICFVVIVALNSVTESILEVQAGVLFFTFFISAFEAGRRINNH